MIGKKLPNVIFQTRVRDSSIEGDNPYRWQAMSTADYFAGKKILVFSLPGAFTPTCSTYQLPGFESMYQSFRAKGIDEVYCISVNDAFVMNAWSKHQQLINVKVIPDGTGEFTRMMGMLVDKCHLGFGLRSWRYAAVIQDCEVIKWFEEPGINNTGDDTDPYGETDPKKIIEFI